MDRRIESIKKIDDDGHVFWEAWTKSGWCWGSQGLHVLHEDTRKEILAQKWQIQRCCCSECNIAGKKCVVIIDNISEPGYEPDKKKVMEWFTKMEEAK